MTSPVPNLPTKTIGVVLGAAVGDALGWPQEDRSKIVGGQKARNVDPHMAFRRWARNGGTQFARYQEPVEAGSYSDDTQLLLAVARSCLRGAQWTDWFTRVELPLWTLYQRGGGRAVLAAAHCWSRGDAPWNGAGSKQTIEKYFTAGSNGAAMRIAPHALVTIDDPSPAPLLARVVLDGMSTHGHSRALVGACVYALALRTALRQEGTLGYGDLIAAILDDKSWRDFASLTSGAPENWHRAYRETTGQDPEREWATTATEVVGLLQLAKRALANGVMANDERTLDALGCFDQSRNGAGTITAAAAIYIATRSAARPASGLLRAAFMPRGDTDTVASMTAALLGALHGSDWLQQLAAEVQDSDYLHSIAKHLAQPADQVAQDEGPKGVDERDLRRIKNTLQHAEVGTELAWPDGRRLQIEHRDALPTRTKSYVERITMVAADGQALFVDRVSKTPPEAAKSQSAQSGRSEEVAQQPLPLTDDQDHGRASSDPGPSVAIAAIHIRVQDLPRSVAFYRRLGLTSRELDRQTATIGRALVLHQAAERRATPRQPSQVLIEVRTSSLDEVKHQLEGHNVAYKIVPGNDEAIHLNDPDGNDVRLYLAT